MKPGMAGGMMHMAKGDGGKKPMKTKPLTGGVSDHGETVLPMNEDEKRKRKAKSGTSARNPDGTFMARSS